VSGKPALTPLERTVIRKRYIEGFSIHQVAMQLDYSSAWVNEKTQEALKKVVGWYLKEEET
jgi:DNA-directed RNA polymerase specialized sigma24 family protein